VLVGATTQAALIGELVARAHEVFEAEWAAAVDTERALVAAAVGSPPPAAWLAAFVAGSRSSALVAAGDRGPDDAAWSALEGTAVAVVLGRRGRPFRARERRELSALARIAGLRARELDRVGAVRH